MEQMNKRKALFEKEHMVCEVKGGIRFPLMGRTDLDAEAFVGKFGRVWMHLLYENNYARYCELIKTGKIIDKAIGFNTKAYAIMDDVIDLEIRKYPFTDMNLKHEQYYARLQAQITAEEAIIKDMKRSIMNQK